MTEEEFRKEATTTVQWECTPMIDRPTFINGYITGAEPREKQIIELEAQIEKMKCCENCNNFMHRVDHRCNTKCKNLSEWEIKEK
jgi:hypothetical protein